MILDVPTCRTSLRKVLQIVALERAGLTDTPVPMQDKPSSANMKLQDTVELLRGQQELMRCSPIPLYGSLHVGMDLASMKVAPSRDLLCCTRKTSKRYSPEKQIFCCAMLGETLLYQQPKLLPRSADGNLWCMLWQAGVSRADERDERFDRSQRSQVGSGKHLSSLS